MPYCPKCGSTVEETMAFCPTCGLSLKGETPTQPTPNIEKKQEKHETPEKGEYGFVGFLVGGLILITVGAFALLDLTSSVLGSGQEIVLMLVIIGLIIIGGAIYVTTPARRFFIHLIFRPKKIDKT